MRLATFNVENMFERPSIMNLPTWEDGEKVLQDFARLSDLIQKQQYSINDKQEMLTIMKRNSGLATKGESKHILLNEIRGKFLKKQQGTRPAEILANGRNEWIGWFELVRETVKETAIENTARVIHEVNADIRIRAKSRNLVSYRPITSFLVPKYC
jgi:hypothetical protein